MVKRRKKRVATNLWPIATIVLAIVVVLGAAYFWLNKPVYEPTEQNIIKVKLYYYNQLKDKDRTFNSKYVLPVAREIARSKTPIQDAINLLISGRLTWQERTDGFTTEFPNARFQLLGVKLNRGVLVLEFTDVPGFTTGGAARVGVLSEQIVKTAKQFPQVKEVIFKPDYLFQP